MSHRTAPLTGLLLLLAAVGLLPASPAQSPANTPTTLQPNSGAVGPALLQEGTYARVRASASAHPLLLCNAVVHAPSSRSKY
jgi:hypothetical protein